jgi:hypothetical protein
MKKIFCSVLIILLFVNCSNSDNSSSSKSDFKFTLDGYFEFIPVADDDDPSLFWDNYLENNGSTTYTISKRVKRAGSNPLFNQDIITVQLTINVVGALKVNQVYPIANCNFSGDLPYKDGNADWCNQVELTKDGTTLGQIKITSLDNNNLSGTFNFNNLINDFPYVAFGCTSSPSQNRFSISNGVFTNIPKY